MDGSLAELLVLASVYSCFIYEAPSLTLNIYVIFFLFTHTPMPRVEFGPESAYNGSLRH